MISKINIVALIAICMLATACVDGMPLNADRQKLMDALTKEGPQIEGIQGTLIKGAKDATKRGEHQKAAQLYRQLLTMEETSTPYALALADSLRRAGELDKAEMVYEEILQKEPKLIEAKEGFGLLRLSKGEFDKAGILLSEVHKIDPKRWQTLNGLGILLVERGSIDDAISYFKEALKYKENSPSILNNIGLTYAINDEPDNAINAMGKAVEETISGTPQRRATELNLALVLGVYGDMVAAEKILKQHLPDAAIANNLGLYAYLSNDEKLAKSYLNSALSRSPYHYKRAWENLEAITKQSAGDAPKAKSIKLPK
jgi:Flp pilus assembly protein TadD